MKVPALAMAVVLAAGPIFCQTFEVASVRTIKSWQGGVPDGASSNPHLSAGRLSWTADLSSLLRYAYNLPDWRIVRTDKNQYFYAISATMSATATEDEVRLMLQNLLADRFKLASHREMKEVQGYGLIVDKKGPKMKASAPGDTPPMPEYLRGKPPAAFEGRIFVSMEGKGTSALTGRGVSTGQLAQTLSATLGAPVLDQSGLSGNYYFGFKFLAVNSSPTLDVDGPTLSVALQEELGLKLEKQKAMADLLVVDHFESPSEN